MNILFATILAAGLIGPLDHTIVSPAWLEQNLNDPWVVVVEVGPKQPLDHAHIPMAHFLAIESIVKEGWPPNELPPVNELRKAFENAGVGDNGRIILYSADPLLATRAWFTLDYLGQGDRTAILDGGFARWTAERRPVTSKRFVYTAKTFTPHPDPSRLVTMPEVRTALDTGAVLIDARPVHQFYGFRRGEQVTRRGHIPGAHCNSWQSNLTRNGAFRTPDELATAYAEMIGAQDKRVIVYCRTGMEASMPYFVLRSLGYNVALYDGSYTEWSRERTNPVARLSSRR